jgi:hypothetical protein
MRGLSQWGQVLHSGRIVMRGIADGGWSTKLHALMEILCSIIATAATYQVEGVLQPGTMTSIGIYSNPHVVIALPLADYRLRMQRKWRANDSPILCGPVTINCRRPSFCIFVKAGLIYQ